MTWQPSFCCFLHVKALQQLILKRFHRQMQHVQKDDGLRLQRLWMRTTCSNPSETVWQGFHWAASHGNRPTKGLVQAMHQPYALILDLLDILKALSVSMTAHHASDGELPVGQGVQHKRPGCTVSKQLKLCIDRSIDVHAMTSSNGTDRRPSC